MSRVIGGAERSDRRRASRCHHQVSRACPRCQVRGHCGAGLGRPAGPVWWGQWLPWAPAPGAPLSGLLPAGPLLAVLGRLLSAAGPQGQPCLSLPLPLLTPERISSHCGTLRALCMPVTETGNPPPFCPSELDPRVSSLSSLLSTCTARRPLALNRDSVGSGLPQASVCSSVTCQEPWAGPGLPSSQAFMQPSGARAPLSPLPRAAVAVVSL